MRNIREYTLVRTGPGLATRKCSMLALSTDKEIALNVRMAVIETQDYFYLFRSSSELLQLDAP
jgi:hypothetical protein